MESVMSGQKHKNSSKHQVANKPSAQTTLQLQADAAKSKNVENVASQTKGQEKMSVVAKTQIDNTQKSDVVKKIEAQAEAKSAPRLVAASATAPVVAKAEAKENKSDVNIAKAVIASSSTAAASAASGLVNAGTNAISEIVSASSSQAQKAQEKAVAVVRESAEHVSRSAQAATRSLDEAINVSHEQIEAIMQYSNIAGENARKLMDELFTYTNDIFARNVELSREVFSCRTVNDAIDLQNKMIQTNVDSMLNEASKISDMFFECATQVCDPIGERMSEVMERFTKTIAA
jgi:hypothetical protein